MARSTRPAARRRGACACRDASAAKGRAPLPPPGLSRQGLRSPPCSGLPGGFAPHVRFSRCPPAGGFALHGRSPRGGPAGFLSCQGLSPRGALRGGLSLQGRSPRGAPPAFRSCHGLSPRGGRPGVHGRSLRGPSPGGLLLHGRSSRGRSPAFLSQGRSLRGRPAAGLPVHGRSFAARRPGWLAAPWPIAARWTGFRPAACRSTADRRGRSPAGSRVRRAVRRWSRGASGFLSCPVDRAAPGAAFFPATACSRAAVRRASPARAIVGGPAVAAASSSDHARTGRCLLLEPIARIFVRAARPPVGVPPLAARRRFGERRFRVALVALEVFLLGLARFPQLAAGEPLHRDVLVLSLELVQGGEELFALARTKCRRCAVDQDRPVGIARRHPHILSGHRSTDCAARVAATTSLAPLLPRRDTGSCGPRSRRRLRSARSSSAARPCGWSSTSARSRRSSRSSRRTRRANRRCQSVQRTERTATMRRGVIPIRKSIRVPGAHTVIGVELSAFLAAAREQLCAVVEDSVRLWSARCALTLASRGA